MGASAFSGITGARAHGALLQFASSAVLAHWSKIPRFATARPDSTHG